MVQVVGVAAVALAVCARFRSSPERSPAFWLWVAIGLVLATTSPTAAVLVGVIALVGVEVRSGTLGLFAFLASLLGVSGMIVSAVAPSAALLVEAPAVLCLLAGAGVALRAERFADATSRG